MNRTGSTTYVMVHSAWLGGWAWRSVATLLEKHGHKVIAPDLPGHGQDKTPPANVTLDSYVKTVTDVLDSQETPAILVGHSLGGIIISQAAENRPDKVKSLVYLCAFLLPSGGSFLKATEGVKGSMVLDNLVMAPDKTYVTIKEEVMHEAFAHDVPDEAFAQAKPMIVPEPTAPLGAGISITQDKWGRIPRYYVECLADKAIPPAVQKAMYTAIPAQKVFSMDTSHVPNLSAPQELAEHLLAVAAS
ncbi:MAG TPA: alpha/beta fold hydrolase [Gemmatimonadaceae bacterium]|nr:alpha/beta fold hydrolase [Gemmatimonadaceae bacterium]